MSPTITVGMPVYNGEAYVAEAISAVLGQTFADFELIISDNASSDGTEEICRGFAASDRRIRYLRCSENAGATWNFNHVLEQARGPFFKWAAHDDLMAPEFLRKCLEVLEADDECVLAFPRTILIDDEGNADACYLDLMASDSPRPSERYRRYMIPGVGEPNPIFGLMRRERVQSACVLDSYSGADTVFLAQIALLGRTRLLEEPLFLRRMHHGASMKTNPDSLSREEFHTGRKARGLRFRMARLAREHARAVNRAAMSRAERLECYRVLLDWVWMHRIAFAKELAVPLYANNRPTALGRWLHHLVRPGVQLRSEKNCN